uniref:Sof1-like protein domain-containing protein n=1 Tax=Strombidium rassoulzadegani TaxID=1082188 RepID=A0A7S3CN24_9SPIT|mmetsp:Transcript_18072/g.30837  ORF Transcript_18072/g.30837 Transcript_18072/m.30837 type:complete len:195 (+) Transcript_18072:835-1419(+)
MNFVIGNENANCYTFDMRKLDQAKLIHKDHVSAILDIDFAPTGREFVAGSFDKTIRIFPFNDGRSREIYHTKRMQQVNSVLYLNDAKYIVSGSEDTNLRIWKSNASEQLKPMVPREKESLAYHQKLKQKFKHNPEIRRILRHRHLPSLILKKKNIGHIQRESRFKKDQNVRINNRIEDRPFIPQRTKDMDKKME